MEEKEAIHFVEKWLSREYPDNKGFQMKCKPKGKGEGLDCEVFRESKLIVQIEVKGSTSSSNIYEGLGECMWWYWERDFGVKTYLAVPYDLKQCSVEEIKQVLEDNNAKFGLLEVRQNGDVEIIRQV